MRVIDLTGKRFGCLTVIRRDGSAMPGGRKGNAKWLCLCDCGQERSVVGSKLQRGEHQSCGCKRRRHISVALTSHGMTQTPTYNSWSGMVQRCTNRNHPRYRRYGGRGIKVCERWMTFENFLKDMGTKPENKTLDRIDNSKGYTMSNCRWASPRQQANNTCSNTLIDIGGVKATVAEVARAAKVTPGAILYRFKRGVRGFQLLAQAAPGRSLSTTSKIADQKKHLQSSTNTANRC